MEPENNNTGPADKYMNEKECAAAIGVCTKTLRRFRNLGMPHIKIGYGCYRYRWEDVNPWMVEHYGVGYKA